MKEEHINHLISKYKAGETSKQEELYLQHHSENLEHEQKDMFKYIHEHKTHAPSNFNEDQWKIFQLRQKQRKINRYSIISVAASLIVVVTLFLMKPAGKEMDITEKQAKLNEALQLIDNTQQVNENDILYEDELVIIYTSN